jgi:hypothetical protein
VSNFIWISSNEIENRRGLNRSQALKRSAEARSFLATAMSLQQPESPLFDAFRHLKTDLIVGVG